MYDLTQTKNTMKKIFYNIFTIIASLSLFTPSLYAQNYIELSNIKVGDTAPDILFSDIDKYKSSEKKLSEFSEKLVIIDFWATWCAPCLKMLPTMDSLMRQFKEDLLFISVTSESQNYAQPFLKKFEINQKSKFKIPTIYGDTVLRKLFPYRTLPHYVWLDTRTKKVVAITRAEEVTNNNIRNFLQNDQSNELSLKLDRWLDYNDSESLLAYLTKLNNPEVKSTPSQYSSFWGYIPDLKGAQYSHLRDSVNNNRILIKNNPKRSIIKYAFGEGRKFFQEKSMIIESKDRDKITTDLERAAYRNWLKQNAITYEISVLPENRDKIFEMMRQDIINYFSNLDIHIEKRKANCLVLTSTGSNESLRSKGGQWQVIKDQFGYRIINSFLDDFIVDLTFYYLQDAPVIVNEVKLIDFNIDMDLKVSDFSDIKQLNAELAKYNLKFVEKEAMAEFLIIKDK